jgi:septum formation protein
MSQARPLFLASNSPRRIQLLSQWGISATCIPNKLTDEILPHNGSEKKFRPHLRRLALEKAKASAKGIEGIVLGADTIVLFKNTVFGKPKDLQHAKSMLHHLSGHSHTILTGVALYDTLSKTSWSFCVKTTLRFKQLSTVQIDAYCQTHSPLDKAGAYGLQDIESEFIDSRIGSRSNVIGLPQYPLLTYLTYWGIAPEQKEKNES